MITRISEWRCLYWRYVIYDCPNDDGTVKRDHQLHTRYLVFQWPAHGDHYMPFSERYGYRRAVHLGRICITRGRSKVTVGWGHTVKRFPAHRGAPDYRR